LIWRSHVSRVTTLARRNIDEVQHVTVRTIARANDHGVVPRNVYRRSLVRPRLLPSKASLLRSRKRPARTPPSTFLFLPIHLSNSPGTMAVPLPGEAGKPSKPESSDRNRTIGHLISEELRRRAIAPESGAARRCGGFIWAPPSPCQQQMPAKFTASSRCGRLPFSPALRPPRGVRAALAPHSSRVVRIGERPVITVRITGCLAAR